MSEIDYQAVIDDLERKRDELDAAINGIRAIMGIQGTPNSAFYRTPGGVRGEQLASDTFFNLSVIETGKGVNAFAV
jgi:hypothetical protein